MPTKKTHRQTTLPVILPMFLRPKPIKVASKAVLEKIADSIHNPKTGHYLNLCDGRLQNGPDPKCETRPMHCGLGELYFVVTGRQPEADGVDENGVVQEIIERSTIHEHALKIWKRNRKAKAKIEALDLPQGMVEAMLEQMDEYVEDDVEEEFSGLLKTIPSTNDDGGNGEDGFKRRAKQVAEQIREAAALLPR